MTVTSCPYPILLTWIGPGLTEIPWRKLLKWYRLELNFTMRGRKGSPNQTERQRARRVFTDQMMSCYAVLRSSVCIDFVHLNAVINNRSRTKGLSRQRNKTIYKCLHSRSKILLSPDLSFERLRDVQRDLMSFSKAIEYGQPGMWWQLVERPQNDTNANHIGRHSENSPVRGTDRNSRR